MAKKLSDALQQSFNVASNILSADTSDNQIKIEMINVECDKNQNGMLVTIEFDQPFAGVIYSQKFYNDPGCRYDYLQILLYFFIILYYEIKIVCQSIK